MGFPFYLFRSPLYLLLGKRLANFGPWTKPGPLVFVNKVLLAHGHIHLFMDCLWLQSRIEGL